MKIIDGFLVVLKPSDNVMVSALNRRYRGVYRIPPYYLSTVPPELEVEQEAQDKYTFGDYTDELGLIPSFEKARELFCLFSKSHRRFETIYCRTFQEDAQLPPVRNYTFLGYDVAGDGCPFYSIVADFPPEPEMRHYLSRLNQWGLFENAVYASSFLDEYRSRKLADYDLPYAIWQVYTA